MSDSISHMYDDYDDYKYICEVNNIKPVGVYDGFYKHEDIILKDLGFKTKYKYFDYLRKVNERDKKINEVLK